METWISPKEKQTTMQTWSTRSKNLGKDGKDLPMEN